MNAILGSHGPSIVQQSYASRIPSLDPPENEGTFMHGKQSILLSSALQLSNTISATKAVTCRRKSSRTAKATDNRQIKVKI